MIKSLPDIIHDIYYMHQKYNIAMIKIHLLNSLNSKIANKLKGYLYIIHYSVLNI